MKPQRCERCGDELPIGDNLADKCVRCLLVMGLATEGPEATEEADDLESYLKAGDELGHYRILRRIGAGGMGIVFEAEQDQPRRKVALKVLKPGVTGSATLRRFAQEAEALGRLQHSGIAQIYESGAADTILGSQPYFAMELIRGLTPSTYVTERRLGFRERLELVARMADAVHHAHQRGLIHRDLKPSNILVDENGQPKVLDFGIARAVDDNASRTHRTKTGQLLGTVAYMSPEQVTADPNDIDIRTDVYALGVILYELLAERPPFNTGGNVHESIRAIREDDPVPLGTLVRDYRGDIETIAAKALEKDKGRRYASAAALATDIRLYLSHQPIIARPPTATYQLKRFARRNRALVAGAIGIAVALLLGVVISTRQARRAQFAEQAALAERDRSRQAEAAANEQRNLALDAQRKAMAAERIANDERDRANLERNRAQVAEEQSRHEATVAKTQRYIALSQELVREALRPETVRDDYELASLFVVQALRFNTRVPGQPRRYIEDALQKAMAWGPQRHRLPAGDGKSYTAVAFSPDGTRLAAGGGDHIVRVWDMRQPGMAPLLLDARGRGIQGIKALSFSSDGRLLAVGSLGFSRADTIRLWNLQNAAGPPVVLETEGMVDSLAIAPHGGHLALVQNSGVTEGKPSTLVLWNLRNPKEPRVLSREPIATNTPSGMVAFSPDGFRLAAALATTVKIWNLRNVSEEPASLQVPTRAASTQPGRIVYSVAFSPDGVHLAVSSLSGIHIWDLQNRQTAPVALATFGNNQQHRFRLLTYTRDGAHLAAADGSAWIWDLKNPSKLPTAYSPSFYAGIDGLGYSPDGARLAAGTPFGIQVWDFSLGGQPSPPLPRGTAVDPSRLSNVRDFVYSSDLTRAFDASDGTFRLWDLRQSPPRVVTLDGHPGPLATSAAPLVDRSASFCNDTRLAVASLAADGVWVSVWDAGGRGGLPQLVSRFNLRGGFSRIACSADGFRLAISLGSDLVRARGTPPQGPTLQIVDLKKSTVPYLSLALNLQGLLTVSPLTFSPDGNTVAFGTGSTIGLWNLTEQTKTAQRSIPASAVPMHLAFSSDGARLAASPTEILNPQGAIWDLPNRDAASRKFLLSSMLAFSPDGSRLATSYRNTVRILDLQDPDAPSLDIPWPAGNVFALGFSPDGLHLSVGDWNGRVARVPLWTAAADSLCTRVWRNLSIKEWQTHIGESVPYESTCPALPPGPR